MLAQCAASETLGKVYATTMQTPIGSFALAILMPLLIAVSFFAKTMLQKQMPIKFSLIVNVIGIAVLCVGAFVLCKPLPVLSFSVQFPAGALLFALQLTSLAYDLFRLWVKSHEKRLKPLS